MIGDQVIVAAVPVLLHAISPPDIPWFVVAGVVDSIKAPTLRRLRANSRKKILECGKATFNPSPAVVLPVGMRRIGTAALHVAECVPLRA